MESNGLLNFKGDRKSFSVNNIAIPKDDPNYGWKMKTEFPKKKWSLANFSPFSHLQIINFEFRYAFKYCATEDLVSNLTTIQIFNTTLGNILAMESSKWEFKYCETIAQVTYDWTWLSVLLDSIFGIYLNKALVLKYFKVIFAFKYQVNW